MKNKKFFENTKMIPGLLFAAMISFVGCIQRIGMQELILILLIILILFGSKKLPELAKSLGRGFRELKKAVKDIESDKDTESNDDKSTSTSKSSESESEKDQYRD